MNRMAGCVLPNQLYVKALFGDDEMGDDESLVWNFKCAFCGRFVSRKALDSFGIPRHWLIASTRDPHSRTSECYKPSELEDKCPEEYRLYNRGIFRLIAYAVQEGVISAKGLSAMAFQADKRGQDGIVAWVERVIEGEDDDDE